jgi:hypothetical protein
MRHAHRSPRAALLFALTLATAGAVAVTLPSRVAFADEAADGAAKEWRETVRLFEAQLAAVNDADRALTAFTTKSKLTGKGKTQTKAVATRLEAARQQLQTTLDAAALLSKRAKATADDAIRFRSSNTQVLADGADAVQKEQAAEQDASLVDHSEAEAAARRAAAEKARADQESARREAEERRKAEEDKRRAEADERKKADEAKRSAEADARRSAEEQRRAAAEASAAMAAAAAANADAKARADVDTKRAALEASVREQGERARDAALALAGFLSKANVTIDARGTATRHQRALESAAASTKALEKKLAEAAGLSTRNAAGALGAIAPEIERSGRDVRATAEAARLLISSSKSYLTGFVPPSTPAPAAPAGAGSAPEPKPQVYRTEDFVPMCDFVFEPAAPDAKSASISIDGAPFKPLPTRIRLASGRHSLSVKRDRALQERRELLLCGHVAVIPIEAPK